MPDLKTLAELGALALRMGAALLERVGNGTVDRERLRALLGDDLASEVAMVMARRKAEEAFTSRR